MIENKKKEIVRNAFKGIKMVDAGTKVMYPHCSEMISETKKPSKRYPYLYLEMGENPIFKDLDVGQEKRMAIKVYVRSHSLNNAVKSGKRENFDLEIREIGLME